MDTLDALAAPRRIPYPTNQNARKSHVSGFPSVLILWVELVDFSCYTSVVVNTQSQEIHRFKIPGLRLARVCCTQAAPLLCGHLIKLARKSMLVLLN